MTARTTRSTLILTDTSPNEGVGLPARGGHWRGALVAGRAGVAGSHLTLIFSPWCRPPAPLSLLSRPPSPSIDASPCPVIMAAIGTPQKAKAKQPYPFWLGESKGEGTRKPDLAHACSVRRRWSGRLLCGHNHPSTRLDKVPNAGEPDRGPAPLLHMRSHTPSTPMQRRRPSSRV